MKHNTYWIRLGIVLLLSILTACGGGGGGGGNGGGGTPLPEATPPDLVDAESQSFIQGQLVSFSLDNIGGQQLTECSSNLPESFSVTVSDDGTTCDISGEAAVPIELTSFTVTAVNLGGSDSATVPIEIVLEPPSLDDVDTQSFIQDELVSFRLTSTGGGLLTECSSDLPAGLSVTVAEDEASCEVNGEATELIELTNFTVTAVNASGSDSAQVPLEIVEASPFITTWETDNGGFSDDNQIMIQTSSEFSYDFRVDWGDDQVDEGVTGDITHTYDTPGEYTVSITGRFPQPFFPESSDAHKLLAVEAWGNRPWLSMNLALADCDNMVINDTQAPNLSRVTDMSWMFAFNDNFNGDISHWDVSNVENMDYLFLEAAAFNQDISGWDVSSVASMESTFEYAEAFNQDIGLWDVSNVANMNEMFRGAVAFDQNIGAWDVGNVTSMLSTFRETVVFNQDIGLWDVSSVTDMRAVFYDADAFNRDIGGWNVSNVTTMNNMFRNAIAFDQNLGSWDVSNVEAMEDFAPGSGLTLPNYNALLIGWSALGVREGVLLDVGTVQYNPEAEAARAVLTDVFGWNISDGGLLSPPDLQTQELTLYTNNPVDFVLGNLGGNPQTCTSNDLPAGVNVQVSQDGGSCRLIGTASTVQAATESTITTSNIAGNNEITVTLLIEEETPFITIWKTDNVGLSDDNQITIDTSPQFSYDYRVDWGDGQFDENVTGDITHTYAAPGEYEVSITGTFPSMQFPNTSDTSISDSLKILSVEQWGDRSWLSMENAFINCDNLVINDTNSPDLAAAKSMREMFARTASFNSDIGGWDVSSITDMSAMFSAANAFNQDIGAWDVSNVTNMFNMFRNADAFNQDIGAWDVSSVRNMASMFEGTELFNQDISGWDVSNVTNMNEMFRQAREFNQEIGSWDVSSVSNMNNMFFAAGVFSGDISGWNVSSVTNMSRMFRGAGQFDQNLGGWDVSLVSNMTELFSANNLSTENYDAILIGWSQLPELRSGVTFSVGSTPFSSDAQAARDILENDFGWIISDGGLVEPGI